MRIRLLSSLVGAALAVLAPGCAGEEAADPRAQLVKGADERPASPDLDGPWTVVTIDGRAVAPREWRIGITRGTVSGGRDGCNDWGFDEPETNGGARTIVSTLVGCRKEDPVRRAYWAMAMAKDVWLEPREDGTLRLAAGGHQAILRRCRWVTEPLPQGVTGRGRRTCSEE